MKRHALTYSPEPQNMHVVIYLQTQHIEDRTGDLSVNFEHGLHSKLWANQSYILRTSL